jgi:PAS domain S-box-containing protein
MEQNRVSPEKEKRAKILIADDNSQNLYLLEVLFKGAGYDVVTATNGVEALEKLHGNRFDGIVSDILMPRMDGFRLIRECRKDPVLRQIPFIFYTATYTEKKDEEFGLSLGAIRYIIKPAEPEELLRQIRDAFSDHARSPRDYAIQPVPDEFTFNREYMQRVGAKLVKKERLLRETEQNYRNLVESISDTLFTISPDFIITYISPVVRTFGLASNEVTGKGFLDFVDPEDMVMVKEAAGSVLSGSDAEIEFRIHNRSGEVFYVHVSARPELKDGNVIGIAGIMKDITSKKDLERLKVEAFRKIEENLIQMAVLNDQIRNPLAVIMASADLAGGTTAETIIRQVKEIDAMIGEVDRKWLESEKVRDFLKRYYGVTGEETKKNTLSGL